MSKVRMTLGMAVFCGVAAASSFSRTLDGFLTWSLVSAVGLLAIYGVGHWLVGEWSVHRECVRPNPRMPHQTPRYWPTKEDARG